MTEALKKKIAFQNPVENFRSMEEDKIEKITKHFKAIMEVLGLDMTTDNLSDTPARVARMYVTEIFSGLNAISFPEVCLFDNRFGYHEMLVEKNMALYSYCEHYFLPFAGKAHVAYFPGSKVVGLSKLNRIVRHFCQRPQTQERLTSDIAQCLKDVLQTEDVAVCIQAFHFSIAVRGIEDAHSNITTTHFGGQFSQEIHKQLFYDAFNKN